MEIENGRKASVQELLSGERKQETWPFLFWIYVKSLGLYHRGRLIYPRRCHKCTKQMLKRSQNTSKFMYTEDSCVVCESFTWNHKGKPTCLTQSSIGADRLNHKGSGVVSVLWLLLVLTLSLADIALVIANYHTSSIDLVMMLSQIGFKGILTIAPMTCFIGMVFTTWPDVMPGNWASIADIQFLIQRLRHVNMKMKRRTGYFILTFMVFIMASECVIVAAQLFDYASPISIALHSNQTYTEYSTYYLFTSNIPLDFFIAIEGVFNFGGLVYIVYLLRCSYECEIKLITIFLRKHIDNVDLCRRRLAEAFDAFHRFREFTSGWIALHFLLASIGLLLELHRWIVATATVKLWSYQRALFFILFLVAPILAIGNVHVDYLWNRLVRKVSRQRKMEKEQSWDKIMQFLQEQRAGDRPWQTVFAFFLSTIAVFAAIQFRVWNIPHTANKVVNIYNTPNNNTVVGPT